VLSISCSDFGGCSSSTTAKAPVAAAEVGEEPVSALALSVDAMLIANEMEKNGPQQSKPAKSIVLIVFKCC
jgi:hypothetical protein